MSDIIERLWEYGTVVGRPLTAQDRACHAAVAEIERLRAELADERKYNRIVCEMSEACVQCQDLRALLAEARQCVRAECGEMEQFACRPGMHPDAYLWANERISYYAGLLTRIDAALAGSCMERTGAAGLGASEGI